MKLFGVFVILSLFSSSIFASMAIQNKVNTEPQIGDSGVAMVHEHSVSYFVYKVRVVDIAKDLYGKKSYFIEPLEIDELGISVSPKWVSQLALHNKSEGECMDYTSFDPKGHRVCVGWEVLSQYYNYTDTAYYEKFEVLEFWGTFVKLKNKDTQKITYMSIGETGYLYLKLKDDQNLPVNCITPAVETLCIGDVLKSPVGTVKNFFRSTDESSIKIEIESVTGTILYRNLWEVYK